MSIRKRTTKLVAKRHDLNYFKRMSPVRAWQWGLACIALIAALAWFTTSTLMHGGAVLSAGPMSSSHAVIGERCELCHVPVIGATRFTPSLGMRRHVPDSACLQCHTAAPHHPMESTKNPTCASCHTEHVGAMHLATTADSGCTQCHAKLESRAGVLRVSASVTSFAANHPEFEPLRTSTHADKTAATALVFNHTEHMKSGLKGPNGPTSLACATCHTASLRLEGPQAGRQGDRMEPVSFERSCQSCHTLQFDAHLQTEAPHKSPAEVHTFVTAAITAFAQSHPDVVAAEVRNWPPQPPLPGRVPLLAPRNQQEWIATSIARSEIILWRERCGLCHKTDASLKSTDTSLKSTDTSLKAMGTSLKGTGFSPYENAHNNAGASAPEGTALPVYQAVKQPSRWFSSAIFSHPAHQAVECAECHIKALGSTEEHDQLMPSIATCRRCHDGRSSPQGPALASGHAESGCALCHTFHGPNEATLTVKGLPLHRLLHSNF